MGIAKKTVNNTSTGAKNNQALNCRRIRSFMIFRIPVEYWTCSIINETFSCNLKKMRPQADPFAAERPASHPVEKAAWRL